MILPDLRFTRHLLVVLPLGYAVHFFPLGWQDPSRVITTSKRQPVSFRLGG